MGSAAPAVRAGDVGAAGGSRAAGRLVADLGADSLDITELEAASEELFGVSLRGTDKSAVATVGDVAELIVRLRTGTPDAHTTLAR